SRSVPAVGHTRSPGVRDDERRAPWLDSGARVDPRQDQRGHERVLTLVGPLLVTSIPPHAARACRRWKAAARSAFPCSTRTWKRRRPFRTGATGRTAP